MSNNFSTIGLPRAHLPTDRWRLGSTARRIARTSWAFCLCLCLCVGCGATIHEAGESSLDPRTLPEDIKEPYAVFTVHCSKCHSLSRPLTAHVSGPEHWTRYVNRMRRQPASGINPIDAQMILRFLYWYEEKKREDERRENSESSDNDSQRELHHANEERPQMHAYAALAPLGSSERNGPQWRSR